MLFFNKFKILCKNFGQKMLDFMLDLLWPENIEIQKIINLNNEDLYCLLPKSKVNLENVFVLFDYGNKIVKLIIKNIKYKNHPKFKKIIAKYLFDEIIAISEDIALFDGSPPIIVPMPMSKKEKETRGFNQCEEILKEIEKISGKSLSIFYNILLKIKETRRQTKLNKEERSKNVKNSQTSTTNLKNKTIIILDDVYTTLSTFREAERALKSAGAKRIIGLFIAH